MHSSHEKRNFTAGDYLKFIVPSVIGVLLLMFPIRLEGQTTILVAMLAGKLTGLLEPILPTIILIVIAISGIMAVIYRFFKPDFIENSEILKSLFKVSDFWIAARIVGLILCALVYFEIGPEFIWSGDTGGLILYDLILGLFSIFLFAGFILPFLTDFGLLEFIGAIITPVMRPIFQLPGRSAIDCIASWVGDGTIGVVITNKQYEEGYYTTKEASVIATTFSAVSITFCLVVLNQVGLTHLFGPYYLAVTLAGVIAAIIMPRIPPLSRKPHNYYTGEKKDLGEDIPKGFTTVSWGAHLAISRAEQGMNVNNSHQWNYNRLGYVDRGNACNNGLWYHSPYNSRGYSRIRMVRKALYSNTQSIEGALCGRGFSDSGSWLCRYVPTCGNRGYHTK